MSARLKTQPYLTSGTVTELSAILVERITCKEESYSGKSRNLVTLHACSKSFIKICPLHLLR